MSDICLVTGANGHLGNTLVRMLIEKGMPVRAGVRNTGNRIPFAGLDCDIVYADLLDRISLRAALKDVYTLYQVAAVFRLWDRKAEEVIVRNNLEGTRAILEEAKLCGVKKVVYVSSIAAVDHDALPMTEATWSTENTDPYHRSKIESERLALKMAEKLGLWLVTVLPGAMVGPNCHGPLTPTMDLLDSVLNNKLPIDINFNFNHVDVRDVAMAMIAAAENGRSGERYLLANDRSTGTTDLFRIAAGLKANIKQPAKPSRRLVMTLAWIMEWTAKLTGVPPKITRSVVQNYYGADQRCDNSKAKAALGFSPRSPETALEEAFEYLLECAVRGMEKSSPGLGAKPKATT